MYIHSQKYEFGSRYYIGYCAIKENMMTQLIRAFNYHAKRNKACHMGREIFIPTRRPDASIRRIRIIFRIV